MKKKLLIVFASLMMAALCCSVGFASTGDGNGGTQEPKDTETISFSTSRTSGTTASVGIYVSYSQTVDQYSVVVYLQKQASDGTWSTDTSNADSILYNNGLNKSSFMFSHKYTGLVRGTAYRIKCVSKDYINGVSHITTAYSNTF